MPEFWGHIGHFFAVSENGPTGCRQRAGIRRMKVENKIHAQNLCKIVQ